MVLRIQRVSGIVIASLATIGCVSYPRPYPWNFPSEEEWNQPLETSWQNAVDMYKRLTAPKGRVWDPLMQNYQQDLSYGSQ
jgi:hypothetical protein